MKREQNQGKFEVSCKCMVLVQTQACSMYFCAHHYKAANAKVFIAASVFTVVFCISWHLNGIVHLKSFNADTAVTSVIS